MKTLKFLTTFALVALVSIVVVGQVFANTNQYSFNLTLPCQCGGIGGYGTTNNEWKDTSTRAQVNLSYHQRGVKAKIEMWNNSGSGSWIDLANNNIWYNLPNIAGSTYPQSIHVTFRNKNLLYSNNIVGSWIPN